MSARLGRAATALALAAAALCLSGCSFLAQDMFPNYLQYEEASFDLGAALDAKGLSYNGISRIARICPSGGTARLLILLETDSGRRLAVLDDALGGIEYLSDASLSGSLAPFMLADASGNYVCGRVLLDASLTASTMSTGSTEMTFSDSRGYLGSGGATLLRMNGGSQLYATTFSSWSVAPGSSYPQLFEDASSAYLADALSLDADSPFVLAVLPNSGSQPRILVYANRAAFETALALTYATYAAYGATIFTPSFSIDSKRIWLTAGGATALRYDNDRKVLVRIGYSSGEELDRLYLDDTAGDDTYGFDARGSYWYRYHSATRRLYKMRTWW